MHTAPLDEVPFYGCLVEYSWSSFTVLSKPILAFCFAVVALLLCALLALVDMVL